jgi:16S rRNA (guanine1207-N2)-methyltransferase
VTTSDPRLSLEARVDSGRSHYEFRTVDGLVSPETFRDEELLLLETLWDRDLGDLLVVQANYGVVGIVLAASVDAVEMTETSARAARVCRENLSLNDVDATVFLVPSPAEVTGTFDTACYAPTGYIPVALGKQRLVDALATLAPGGRLYVAGRTETGLDRYERCLDRHCQRVETVHESGDTRVVEAVRPDEFTPQEYVTSRTISATIGDVDLSLVSVPGLFSADSLDHGTRFLLETVDVRNGERVLDICCGYGPIGTYAAAVADVEVVLSDDGVRATACAQRSLEATGLEGTVLTADGTRGLDGQFDRVLCNPPTHAGDGVLSELFGGVAGHLVSGGELAVVHHSRLDLDTYLETVGTIVDRELGAEHAVVTVRS